MPPHVLIPCKSLQSGKSRLDSVMDVAQRTRLCETLLDKTLSVAAEISGPGHYHLVTSDARAAALGRSRGASVLPDPGRGLNAALRGAIDSLMAQAADLRVCMILPIDLPLATAVPLAAALRARDTVVIAPDERKDGTNVLVLAGRALAAFPLSFGPGSFPRHLKAARQAGYAVRVLDEPSLAFDVDEPADYRRWAQRQQEEVE